VFSAFLHIFTPYQILMARAVLRGRRSPQRTGFPFRNHSAAEEGKGMSDNGAFSPELHDGLLSQSEDARSF
jgi:hypothetical protein